MREDIEISNFGEEATFCSVEIQLGADFADLFEVKEGRVQKHGRLSVQHENGRVTFSYTRGAFRRATFVDFSEVPRIAGEHVTYEVIIPPRGTWSTCMQVTPVLDTQEITPRYVCGQPVERSTPAARLEEWTRRLPVVTSDDDQFRELLQRSTRDLAALRIFDPEYPDRAVVAAGAPWFMTLFGRDSLLTSWMTMLVDPDLALGTLQTLARFQGTQVDPITEEEPGRILHEMRFGESSSLALGGGRVYYGTADATPLFVMLIGELNALGEPPRRGRCIDPGRRSRACLDHGLRRQGRRRLRRVRRARATGACSIRAGRTPGTRCASWTDRWRRHPIALCEVQGYVYAALVARSHMATESGDHELAESLRIRAHELKRRFNEDFWVDRDDGGYFAIGLDRDKNKIDGIGSNMGHCLWTGIVDEEKAGAVARALTDPEMLSGWGVRTLSESVRGYNPLSYHCGSVWPHDNAICAAGLMRYGFVAEAHQVMFGLVEASAWFGNLLPELFAGTPRGDVGFPVPYPTSCSPQAWAAASPLLFLRTMLRFEPDFRNSKLHLAPAIPEWIGRLRLERIPVMGGHLTIDVEGEIVHTLEVPEGLELVAQPREATQ